jgi:hypothetical protein
MSNLENLDYLYRVPAIDPAVLNLDVTTLVNTRRFIDVSRPHDEDLLLTGYYGLTIADVNRGEIPVHGRAVTERRVVQKGSEFNYLLEQYDRIVKYDQFDTRIELKIRMAEMAIDTYRNYDVLVKAYSQIDPERSLAYRAIRSQIALEPARAIDDLLPADPKLQEHLLAYEQPVTGQHPNYASADF